MNLKNSLNSDSLKIKPLNLKEEIVKSEVSTIKRIVYPENHVFYIDRTKKVLDRVFNNSVKATRKILNPLSILSDLNVNLNRLKQVYRVQEDKFLRFDHTHVLMTETSDFNISVNHFGPVFRKEPSNESNRWREFYQYDMDYLFEDYDLQPLVKWMQFLGPKVKIKINEKTMTFGKDSLENLELIIHKYPLLDHIKDQIIVDLEFQRNDAFYSNLIFEIFHETNLNLALTGGGIYLLQDKKILGLGIGLNRLINLALSQEDPDLKNQLLPYDKCVYIRYKNQIPYNLLKNLDCNCIPYHLKKIKDNLFKEYRKQSKLLESYRIKISLILNVSDQEDHLKKYNVKFRNDTLKNYDLNQLIDRIKVLLTDSIP